MALTDKEVKHIATLARIEISPSEEEQLKKELSSTLDYIAQLNKVDTKSVEPLYQVTGLVNSTRADEYRNDFVTDENLNAKLVGQAPHREGQFVKVKSVLFHK